MAQSNRTFVVSDPHGHRHELEAALQAQGLLDGRGDWSAGETTLWFLGDFFDRGPDGVGVVELVMRLQHQAADSGGHVGAVLGNHEVLALGMYRFGEIRAAAVSAETRQVQMMWYQNGGLVEDQLRLSDDHLNWLHSLPAMALHGDRLLLHSDTLLYLTYGDSVEAINTALRSTLSAGLEDWWEAWSRLTHRYDFVNAGAPAVRQLTDRLGGAGVVHGHSFVADLTHKEPYQVTGPYLYADGTALAIDGGLYAGGPLLVVELDG
jgi:Calcineurin-like phosphoesterase